MEASRTTWWPVGCLAVGTMLIAFPIIGVLVWGPSDPYAAVTLVFAGLGAVAVACGIVVYRLARRISSRGVAAALAVIGAAPAALPIFGSVSIELAGVVLYGLVLAGGNWALDRRSRPAIAFVALWVVAAAAMTAVLLGGR